MIRNLEQSRPDARRNTTASCYGLWTRYKRILGKAEEEGTRRLMLASGWSAIRILAPNGVLGHYCRVPLRPPLKCADPAARVRG